MCDERGGGGLKCGMVSRVSAKGEGGFDVLPCNLDNKPNVRQPQEKEKERDAQECERRT